MTLPFSYNPRPVYDATQAPTFGSAFLAAMRQQQLLNLEKQKLAATNREIAVRELEQKSAEKVDAANIARLTTEVEELRRQAQFQVEVKAATPEMAALVWGLSDEQLRNPEFMGKLHEGKSAAQIAAINNAVTFKSQTFQADATRTLNVAQANYYGDLAKSVRAEMVRQNAEHPLRLAELRGIIALQRRQGELTDAQARREVAYAAVLVQQELLTAQEVAALTEQVTVQRQLVRRITDSDVLGTYDPEKALYLALDPSIISTMFNMDTTEIAARRDYARNLWEMVGAPVADAMAEWDEIVTDPVTMRAAILTSMKTMLLSDREIEKRLEEFDNMGLKEAALEFADIYLQHRDVKLAERILDRQLVDGLLADPNEGPEAVVDIIRRMRRESTGQVAEAIDRFEQDLTPAQSRVVDGIVRQLQDGTLAPEALPTELLRISDPEDRLKVFLSIQRATRMGFVMPPEVFGSTAPLRRPLQGVSPGGQ